MTHAHTSSDIKEDIRQLVVHLEHVIPGQAPIRDFVHHNTLHGFQHLEFSDALSAAEKITGAHGYLPEYEFRKFYKQGRISREDLAAVIGDSLDADDTVINIEGIEITRRDIYLIALCHEVSAVSQNRFAWLIQEDNAFECFQDDIDDDTKQQCLHRSNTVNEASAVSQLANACLQVLKLKYEDVHPEELLDLGIDQAEQILGNLQDEAKSSGQPIIHRLVRKEAEHQLNQLIERVGNELTLRAFLKMLTGEDILDEMLPVLIRHISQYLDQGMASWHVDNKGFYRQWKNFAANDLAWVFDGIEEARDELAVLEDDAMDAIIHELHRIGLPRAKWTDYLKQLAIEIPGWSGMFLWRHNHPDYEGHRRVEMLDYLAVRLIMERILAQQLSRKHWLLEPRIDVLRAYFRTHRSEFIVRYQLYNSQLPEYLVTAVQSLITTSTVNSTDYKTWIRLSDRLWTWRNSFADMRGSGYSLYRHAWPLFHLAQHLGLAADDIRKLDTNCLDTVFDTLNRLTTNVRGKIWLLAYERNYREKLFNVLTLNHGRGRWKTRDKRPQAQIVFCMDDREEGMRRHLEEHNPDIETMGAAGFFGVAINWQGLDDSKTTPLCPIVVTPAHNVAERPQQHAQQLYRLHVHRRKNRLWLQNWVYQEHRRNVASSAVITVLTAPIMLLALVGKTFLPRKTLQLATKLRTWFDKNIDTGVQINTENPQQQATPELPRNGFTNEEQADLVSGFLQTIGLTEGFSRFPVMMGHGSDSQNNPHLAAYDCGACSGRHGGPNARVFAAMANRPETRELLSNRGIMIPDDTWFLGAEHNTCNDSISWYDEAAIPEALIDDFNSLKQDMIVASMGSAHERCRRFASAPANPDRNNALKHVIARSLDFSQARPELGHATNAVAIIGRRSLSQGAFFDRRAFLISYSPVQDAEGTILERILLAAGPVGAGINLEYYFSTINNDQYGCGSKITHNLTGMFGVMDGASSDLRTGLPKQMIEIHEAMRLLVVVEAKTDVLASIYNRQPPLKELIGNGWLLLAAIDPDSGSISMFEPDKGFVAWKGEITQLEEADCSSDLYAGQSGPLPFALIKDTRHG